MLYFLDQSIDFGVASIRVLQHELPFVLLHLLSRTLFVLVLQFVDFPVELVLLFLQGRLHGLQLFLRFGVFFLLFLDLFFELCDIQLVQNALVRVLVDGFGLLHLPNESQLFLQVLLLLLLGVHYLLQFLHIIYFHQIRLRVYRVVVASVRNLGVVGLHRVLGLLVSDYFFQGVS